MRDVEATDCDDATIHHSSPHHPYSRGDGSREERKRRFGPCVIYAVDGPARGGRLHMERSGRLVGRKGGRMMLPLIIMANIV